MSWVFVAVQGVSLAVVRGILIAVASCCRTWTLRCVGSVVVTHRLNCPEVCGIFLDQGLNAGPHALAVRFLSTGPSGKSPSLLLYNTDCCLLRRGSSWLHLFGAKRTSSSWRKVPGSPPALESLLSVEHSWCIFSESTDAQVESIAVSLWGWEVFFVILNMEIMQKTGIDNREGCYW